ncbi:MAG: hypothetical protein GXO63_01670 [Candidatus Micrarchaeota archaeon]|nr:hypothetical protein [Candidatus Micrarchaeota archaeon]
MKGQYHLIDLLVAAGILVLIVFLVASVLVQHPSGDLVERSVRAIDTLVS